MSETQVPLIDIKVSTKYREEYSIPSQFYYVFSYQITIVNKSSKTVQLLSRHWKIYDSIGDFSEVKGDGVVGNQPILLPNESFSYVSGCSFKSELGKMKGSYLFRVKSQNQNYYFEVPIPEFVMNVPHLLN